MLILLTVACGRTNPSAIVFAVATAPAVLDPRLAGDAASERVNALLYDRLVSIDRQGRAQPAMATWQAISPRHFRFTLRPDRAAFTDGRRPDADDVVATYRSVLDKSLGSPHAGALMHLAEITAVSLDQIDVKLSRPDPLFPSRLSVGIVPASMAASREPIQTPTGSGAFDFVRRDDDGSLLLRRRNDGQLVAFEPVADPTMRVLKLLRGEANLLQNDLPSELYDYLGGRQAVGMQQRPGSTFAYLGFNLADPVLSNRNVRAAIAHAIDRDAIIRYLFGGRAEKAEAVLRPAHWAGNDTLGEYRFDPAIARQYLARAGFGPHKPLRLSYKTSTDPLRLRIAHVFKDQLADVGIELNIASYDWGTFFGDIKAGRFQLYSLAWVGVNTPDILRYAFHSESRPPGGANRGRYRSASVDDLIDTAALLVPEKAGTLYAEAQRRIHDDLVYVPLWYESNVAAMRGVEGYLPGYDGNYLALATVRWTRD